MFFVDRLILRPLILKSYLFRCDRLSCGFDLSVGLVCSVLGEVFCLRELIFDVIVNFSFGT